MCCIVHLTRGHFYFRVYALSQLRQQQQRHRWRRLNIMNMIINWVAWARENKKLDLRVDITLYSTRCVCLCMREILKWSTELIKVIRGRMCVCVISTNIRHAVIMGWGFFSLCSLLLGLFSAICLQCYAPLITMLCVRFNTHYFFSFQLCALAIYIYGVQYACIFIVESFWLIPNTF